MSSSSRRTTKNAKHRGDSSNATESSEFNFTKSNVITTSNAAIDLILETLNMFEKLDISSSSNAGSNREDNSKSIVRGKLNAALDVLRQMTPNNRMHFNQLPDDCLLTIFVKHFSLREMIGSFRRVCRRWKAVVEDSVCAPKRSLKLFGSNLDLVEYGRKLIEANMHADEQFKLGNIGQQDHDLVLTRPWNENREVYFFQTLGAIFPNLEHLVVGFHDVSNSKLLICLFIKYFHGLTRLSIFCERDFPKEPAQKSSDLYKLFFRFIDRIKSLKQLDLLRDSIRGCDNVADHLSNLLPKLEHLSIENCGVTASILSKLSPNLKSLRLDQFDNFQEAIKGSLKPELIANINELRVSKVNDLQVVKFVCQTFVHLNKLELSFEVWGDYKDAIFPLDSHLLTTLNLLPRLESLSLENLIIDMKSLTSSACQPSSVKSLHLSNLSPDQLGTDGTEHVRVLASNFPLIHKLDYEFGIPGNGRTYQDNCNINNDEYLREQFSLLCECNVYERHYAFEYCGRHVPICTTLYYIRYWSTLTDYAGSDQSDDSNSESDVSSDSD